MSVITQPAVTDQAALGAATKRHASPQHQPARVCTAPAGTRPGRLDGAWWPRSRDLAAELPSLIDALDRRWGRITRITVNPAPWTGVPRKVQAAGRLVHVGWFTAEQDPHDMLLLSHPLSRWNLLVIPPGTGPAAADRLMIAAADPRNTFTADALIAGETHRAAGEPRETVEADAARESAWESEGGPVASAHLYRSRASVGSCTHSAGV